MNFRQGKNLLRDIHALLLLFLKNLLTGLPENQLKTDINFETITNQLNFYPNTIVVKILLRFLQ